MKILRILLVPLLLALGACKIPGTVDLNGQRIPVPAPVAEAVEAVLPPGSPTPVFEIAVSNVRGDCEQFHDMAITAGMSESEWEHFQPIIHRESFCCPNVLGGDYTSSDGSCTVVGVGSYSHRSDAGLGQINGTHYSPSHSSNHGRAPWMCAQFEVCNAAQLLDPFTNLVMMHQLYLRDGWSPWGG